MQRKLQPKPDRAYCVAEYIDSVAVGCKGNIPQQFQCLNTNRCPSIIHQPSRHEMDFTRPEMATKGNWGFIQENCKQKWTLFKNIFHKEPGLPPKNTTRPRPLDSASATADTPKPGSPNTHVREVAEIVGAPLPPPPPSHLPQEDLASKHFLNNHRQ